MHFVKTTIHFLLPRHRPPALRAPFKIAIYVMMLLLVILALAGFTVTTKGTVYRIINAILLGARTAIKPILHVQNAIRAIISQARHALYAVLVFPTVSPVTPHLQQALLVLRCHVIRASKVII